MSLSFHTKTVFGSKSIVDSNVVVITYIMRKIHIALFLISFIFVSCNKNNKINSSSLDNQENENICHEENKLDLEELENKENSLETEIEQALKTFTPAIELVSEYDFEPVSDFDLKLMDFSTL